MATLGIPTEHEEQSALVDWLTLRGIPHFAVDNEQHKSNSFALDKWRKAHGFKSGAPDLVILALAPKTKRPVVVEMKRTKGGKHTPAQKYIAAICRRQGFHYILAKGAVEAINELVDLGFGVDRGPRWEISDNDKATIQFWEMQEVCGRSTLGKVARRQMGSVGRAKTQVNDGRGQRRRRNRNG